ncbi:MAG: outer membrane beta-barrel protein [Ignavibacteriota bacterium]
MKNITNIIIGITAFAVINCASTVSFAQKHSKKSYSDNYSYAPSHSYSNNSGEGSWKFGGDVGLGFSFASAEGGQSSNLPGSATGTSFSFSGCADYSVSDKVGIEGMLGFGHGSTTQTIRSGDGSNSELDFHIGRSAFGFGLSVRYDLSKNLFLTAGPSITLPIGSETISADMNGRHAEAEVDGTGAAHLAIGIGAGYRINIANNIQLVPRVSYHYSPATGTVTAIGNGMALKPASVSSFQTSIGIMTSF